MAVAKIARIEDLLVIGKDKEIVDHKVKRLTAPGENYGSLMLSVDVTLKTPQGNEELNLVAKMVPPNDFIQEMFNTQVTFRNEIGFYKDIVPTLQQFQREHGVKEVIDIAAAYFGSRVNLGDNIEGKVDSDAALVLENLKVKGFTTLDRIEQFDEDVAKMILEDMAKLHGVALALKVQKPEVFEQKVKCHLKTWEVKKHAFDDMSKGFLKMLDKYPEVKELRERACTSFNQLQEEHPAREPFATVAHNDIWINNVMIKLEKGKPVESKLVDFQVCSYGSPARDVLFFLFSSVKIRVLKESIDDLIKYYYDHFRATLEEVNCELGQFSFEAFQKELEYEAKYSQFGHTMFMLFPIFLPPQNVKDVTELSPETMSEEVEPLDAYKEKFVYVIEEFARRNWL